MKVLKICEKYQAIISADVKSDYLIKWRQEVKDLVAVIFLRSAFKDTYLPKKVMYFSFEFNPSWYFSIKNRGRAGVGFFATN